MATQLTIFADDDVTMGLQLYIKEHSQYEIACVADSFEMCFLATKQLSTDAVVIQLQIQSDITGCLDFMHALDNSNCLPAILLFEKRENNQILFTTTDTTLNPLAEDISKLFKRSVEGTYDTKFTLFRPAILEHRLLKDSVLGKEEALSEILRGCSEKESNLYKKFYSLDLRDHGYYLFFWELQNTEYQSHYFNKDVYNFMGSILEKKYMSILKKYEGGEAFRLSMDRRCIIINDLTAKSEALKHKKREEMIRELTGCGNCKTASSYISDRVDKLKDLRLARDQYEKDKSSIFFLRYKGILRAGELRLLRNSQKVDLESALPNIQKICNYICYDISNPSLSDELYHLFFNIIKPSMSYALYYYCVTAICSELMKADKSTDMNMLTEALTPELLRFSSIEEQYDIIMKYISIFRQKDGSRGKTKNTIVVQAKEYIANNYDKDISIPEIAGALYVSHMYLSQLFKNATGTSVINYIVNFRIQKAKEMLEEQDCSVSDVAESSGFHDIKHFSKTFKNVVGISPTAYRKKIRTQGI